MFRKIARLFVIKTRFEAWLVTYAIALGAIERGTTYLERYPNGWGLALALACCGVVFVAGAKLLDAVRPAAPAVVMGPHTAPVRRHDLPPRRLHLSDSRRTASRPRHAATRR